MYSSDNSTALYCLSSRYFSFFSSFFCFCSCFFFFFFSLVFFFFNATATTEIYTLSLHDALPIYLTIDANGDIILTDRFNFNDSQDVKDLEDAKNAIFDIRSEEHTSELQSRLHLVCRLLLGKNKSELQSRLHLV